MSELPERPKILYVDLDLEIGFGSGGQEMGGERLLAFLSFAPSPDWCQRFNRAGRKAGGYLGAAEVAGSTIHFVALQYRSSTAVAQLTCLVEEVSLGAVDEVPATSDIVVAVPESHRRSVRASIRRGQRRGTHGNGH
jgi:hypothetical protein